MNFDFYRAELERNIAVFRALVTGLNEEQARFKPPGQWSVLEVVCHLADEERDDFRARLDTLLHHPELDLPEIDPRNWVWQRGYASRNLPDALEDFLRERQASLHWLAGLEQPDWTCQRRFEWGALHAGDVLVSWLAHDRIHIRQINRLLYEQAQSQAGVFSARYAGDW